VKKYSSSYFNLKNMTDQLDLLTEEELKDLVRIYARNIYALDGVWFRSMETECGMGRYVA
jgi:hypothetical protein